MCGFIAQLREQRTGNVEVTGLNPVEALIFFRLLLSNCLNWKIYCDDHSSLSYLAVKVSFTVACEKNINIYILSVLTWSLLGVHKKLGPQAWAMPRSVSFRG